MRRVVILLLGVGIVSAAGYAIFGSSTIEVVNPAVEREVVVEEVTVDNIEARIAEAQEAARAEIETKADEMRAQYIDNEMKTIEAAVLAEVEAELEARRIGLEKETGAYWRSVENLRREARLKAEEYGVSYAAMAAIISCESGWNPNIQSNHVYTVTNAPPGYTAGQREMSFGLSQIHLPVHPHITKAQALDPEFALDFLARNLAAGRASMWTCARQLALL